MNGSKTARFAPPAAPFLAVTAAFGAWASLVAGCDVTSVVGYEESALGVLQCARDAPVARCDQVTCVVRDLEAAQVGSTALAVDDVAAYYLREANAIVKTPVGGGDMVDLATSEMGVFHMAAENSLTSPGSLTAPRTNSAGLADATSASFRMKW